MPTVAVDATPLLGRPTGVGTAVAGILAELGRKAWLDVVGYGLTGTGWRDLPAVLPAGVAAGRGPMPARPLLQLWARGDRPPVEWWTGPVDLVHGTNFVVPPSRRAARLVSVHDLTAIRYPQLCAPASLRYPRLVRRAVAAGAHVHTWSAHVAAEVVDAFGAAPERVHVVPGGVTPPASAPVPPDGPPYVLGLGTVEPRKDFPLLVAAFDQVAAAHPDLRLRIAGAPGWGAEALDAAVAAAVHRGRIERLGWVDDPGPLLAGAAVFAYPSVYEGFGFPPLEAMAAGVPVVATAAGSVPEVVGAAAELVAPGDADAFAGAIDRVLTDTAHRHALVAAGRARAAQLSWPAAGEGFAALYREILGS